MSYPHRNSIEAREWLRGYCVRNDLSWRQLLDMMDRMTRWNAAYGQWVPFASKLLADEELRGVSRPTVKQKTLQPALGPILQEINRMRTVDELRDYLATLLFDEMVTIATAVKQKRSSSAKRVQRKAKAVSEQQSDETK